MPNTVYKVDGNKTFQADDLGRVERVESNLSLTKNDRNTYQQCVAGKCGVSGESSAVYIVDYIERIGLSDKLRDYLSASAER